jgi:hypothetical protein
MTEMAWESRAEEWKFLERLAEVKCLLQRVLNRLEGQKPAVKSNENCSP